MLLPNSKRRDHGSLAAEASSSQDFPDVALNDGAERGVKRGDRADPMMTVEAPSGTISTLICVPEHEDTSAPSWRSWMMGAEERVSGALQSRPSTHLQRHLGRLAHRTTRTAEQQPREYPRAAPFTAAVDSWWLAR